jgi:cephalosporin hydroxylase
MGKIQNLGAQAFASTIALVQSFPFLNLRFRKPRCFDPDRSAIPRQLLLKIQAAQFKFSFAGVTFLKNPFDLALYTLLLSNLRPRTIIEIGSYSGGSGLWFSAQARGLELDANVYSYDINPPNGLDSENLKFYYGDVQQLYNSNLPEILANCARPLLVVEDGPHTYDGSLAALNFFDRYLKPGDYIVIEDGIVHELGYLSYDNGPNRAIHDFLLQKGNSYHVDREYCDFYGYNVTWNTNGYIRKIVA